MMIAEVVSRLRGATFQLLSFSQFIAIGLEIAWLAPVLVICTIASDNMGWQPIFDQGTLKLALIAIIAPSLGEELLFRAVMLPRPLQGAHFPWKIAWVSIVLFVVWHPLQAILFGGLRGQIFLDPWFLMAVLALGIGCSRLYWKTASVWPCVILHWLVVIAWKALAGGPALV